MAICKPQLILPVRFLNSLNLKKILGFFLLFLGHMNFVDNVGEDEQILSQRTFQTKSRKQILHKNANIYIFCRRNFNPRIDICVHPTVAEFWGNPSTAIVL